MLNDRNYNKNIVKNKEQDDKPFPIKVTILLSVAPASRQRSGKGAIRKKIPTQKTEVRKLTTMTSKTLKQTKYTDNVKLNHDMTSLERSENFFKAPGVPGGAHIAVVVHTL